MSKVFDFAAALSDTRSLVSQTLFQHGDPDVIARAQIWTTWELFNSFFSTNTFAFSQFCMTPESSEMGSYWLKQPDFVTFRPVSATLGNEVYALLLNSCVKFHANISTHG